MSNLPDISGLSLDQLHELVASASNRIDELKKAKIDELMAKRAELDAELARLSGSPAKPPRMPSGLSESRKRGSPKVTHRGPDGQEYRNRGPIPVWAKKLGAKTKDDMEQWRVAD